LDHQIDMPQVPPPEELANVEQHYRELLDAGAPETIKRRLAQKRPFEFRPVQCADLLRTAKAPPLKHIWFRAVDALPDDEALHRCLLAYVSDFHLLETALRPHAIPLLSPQLVIASLDHAMWFHRRVRVDDWLLHSIESPSSSGARGFTRSSVFTRDGVLVASTSQEGLIRMRT
jgi:acyl-CoA thioesterase-2